MDHESWEEGHDERQLGVGPVMERATLRKISVRRGDKAGTACEDPYRPRLKGAADPTKILQEADNDGPTGFPSEHTAQRNRARIDDEKRQID